MGYTYDTLMGGKADAGSLRNWMNRGDLPAALILAEAESLIAQHLRVTDMVTTVTGTLAAGGAVILAPERFLELRSLRFVTPDIYKLTPIPVEELTDARQYEADGALVRDMPPARFAYMGGGFALQTANDVERGYQVVFMQAPPALGPTQQTNILTDRYPRLLRAALLCAAHEFMKDHGTAAYWLGSLKEQVLSIHEANAAAVRPVVNMVGM